MHYRDSQMANFNMFWRLMVARLAPRDPQITNFDAFWKIVVNISSKESQMANFEMLSVTK